ncbi:MAG: hypothetical protein OEZ01_12225, partial [Candidatus Heimdallarchaeota archaeon]|nr:hypothetical protein [Candidatus Heimdallarchaeota archaeon]
MKIGINGFGRIGRVFVRALLENKNLYNDIELAVINTPGTIDTSLHLLKYDSVYRRFEKKIEKTDEHSAYIDNHRVIFLHNKEKFDWSEYDVDLVVECSGRYRNLESLKNHFGETPVVVSAPADGIKNIIYGVNDSMISKDDQFISAGSCTTNCIAPIL